MSCGSILSGGGQSVFGFKGELVFNLLGSLVYYSGRKAPSHKMQMVFFFFVVNALLSRLRSMVLIRHCFVQEKWPTLANLVLSVIFYWQF